MIVMTEFKKKKSDNIKCFHLQMATATGSGSTKKKKQCANYMCPNKHFTNKMSATWPCREEITL